MGLKGLNKMVNTYENFESIKFKRKDKVIPLLAVNSSIKVGEETICINPLMLFQRMCIVKKSEDEIKDYFKYELAPFPLSLFSEAGMRKGTKSSLYSVFTPLSDELQFGDTHEVVWHRNDLFGAICGKHVRYVQDHFGSHAIVVFDGYPTDGGNTNTKTAERLRRSKKYVSADVLFDETMVVQVSQERFLANENNKVRLISMLKNKFELAAFTVKQAEDDADVLIVNTAISLCSESIFDAVFVVGEDVDLLVLLTALAPAESSIYFRKPGRGKTAERIYSASSLKYEETTKHILFLHAFSGCDTTSSLFTQGKTKFCTLIEKNRAIHEIIEIFNQQDATSEEIAEAGVRFIIALYGGNMDKESLEEVRFQRFAKSTLKSKFNLASLPPTKDSAQFHAFRTYHQVQKWRGIEKNPEDWGWKLGANGLTPITMAKKPAPDSLLTSVSCNCKKGCGGACSCRKAGLKCSVVCGFCNGESCGNMPEIRIESEDENDDIFQATDQNYDQDTDNYDQATDKNQPGASKRTKM